MRHLRPLLLTAAFVMAVHAVDDRYEDSGRSRLGIGMTPTSPSAQAANGLAIDEGVQVEVVFPGTAAEQMGMRAGDVVLAVDGAAVNSMVELRDAIVSRLPGDPITVEVARGGRRVELGAPLGTWPQDQAYPHIDPAWEQAQKDQQRRQLMSDSRTAARLRQQLADLERDLADRAQRIASNEEPRDAALGEAIATLAAMPAWTLAGRWHVAADDVATDPVGVERTPDGARVATAPWRLDYALSSP